MERWKGNIIDVLKIIADRDYQERAWITDRDFTFDPNELYCLLYDNYQFEKFVEQFAPTLALEKENSLRNLLQMLSEYADATPKILEVNTVIRDPRWEQIRRQAQDVLSWLG